MPSNSSGEPAGGNVRLRPREWLVSRYRARAGWLALGVWLAAWVVLLAPPLPGTPVGSSLPLDKAAHLLLFVAVAFCWWGCCKLRGASGWWVAGIVLVTAIGSEALQGVLPYREAEIPDLAADAIGGVLGMWLGRAAFGWSPRTISGRGSAG